MREELNQHAILEVYNDGEVCYAVYEGEGEPQVKETGSSINEIQEALELIDAFINQKTNT